MSCDVVWTWMKAAAALCSGFGMQDQQRAVVLWSSHLLAAHNSAAKRKLGSRHRGEVGGIHLRNGWRYLGSKEKGAEAATRI